MVTSQTCTQRNCFTRWLRITFETLFRPCGVTVPTIKAMEWDGRIPCLFPLGLAARLPLSPEKIPVHRQESAAVVTSHGLG